MPTPAPAPSASKPSAAARAHVWFLERNRAALQVLRENLAALALERRSTVVPGPVLQTLSRHTADLFFLDPPYEEEREYAAALALLGETPPGLVVVQHSVRLELQDAYGGLRRSRILKQGDNALSFFA